MWENNGGARRAIYNKVIRRVRCACWVDKATDIHSEYIIPTVFSRQQWLRERFSVLHLYVHCVFLCFADRASQYIYLSN